MQVVPPDIKSNSSRNLNLLPMADGASKFPSLHDPSLPPMLSANKLSSVEDGSETKIESGLDRAVADSVEKVENSLSEKSFVTAESAKVNKSRFSIAKLRAKLIASARNEKTMKNKRVNNIFRQIYKHPLERKDLFKVRRRYRGVSAVPHFPVSAFANVSNHAV